MRESQGKGAWRLSGVQRALAAAMTCHSNFRGTLTSSPLAEESVPLPFSAFELAIGSVWGSLPFVVRAIGCEELVLDAGGGGATGVFLVTTMLGGKRNRDER